MELSMIGSVIVALTIFETLYWLLHIMLDSKETKKMDQESLDYIQELLDQDKTKTKT